MDNNTQNTICPLCGARAALKYRNHPGYQLPRTFDIFHCPYCRSAFVHPRLTSPEIYDLIYRHANVLPGYSRYLQYAANVKRTANPLDYLANSEDVYWAVAKHLRNRRKTSPNRLQVLEIGSGLGYLTYALAKDGFAVAGYDISRVAVAQAERTFGKLYFCEDIHHFCQKYKNSYDVVIITEVIEHVEEVKDFLSRVLTLLAPRGEVVITTVNRSIYPEGVLWHTEFPPVHLWWFGEESIRRLAAILRCDVTLTDFSEYHKTHYRVYNPNLPINTPTKNSIFDSEGRVLIRPTGPVAKIYLKSSELVKRSFESLGFLSVSTKLRDLIKGNRRFGAQSTSMCAILQKLVD